MLSEKEYFGLGKVPVGIGAVLRGWDLTEAQFRGKLPVIDFRAMLGDFEQNLRTITLSHIKHIIDDAAKMGTRGINFLGEGEPTIDPEFFEIVEYTSSRGITPVVFTDGATKMRDKDFVDRLSKSGASVCLKRDSLFDADYQNWVVGDKTGKYFFQRNDMLGRLQRAGFDKIEPDGTTRLGINMIIAARNICEVGETLRYCRNQNIRIVFTFFSSADKIGTNGCDYSTELTPGEKGEMRKLIHWIDEDEFGFDHRIWSNFATTPCVERMQIYGDGRVSPCPGNETIVGTVQESSLNALHQAILNQFPCHNPICFNGNCLYRQED